LVVASKQGDESRRLLGYFQTQQGVDDVHVKLLDSVHVTRNALFEQLDGFASSMKSSDQLLFYFAGDVASDPISGEPYLVMSNKVSRGREDLLSLSDTILRAKVLGIPSLAVVVDTGLVRDVREFGVDIDQGTTESKAAIVNRNSAKWLTAVSFHPHLDLLLSNGIVGNSGVLEGELTQSLLKALSQKAPTVRGCLKFRDLFQKHEGLLDSHIPESALFFTTAGDDGARGIVDGVVSFPRGPDRGRNGVVSATPPSEPDGRISRIRLSS